MMNTDKVLLAAADLLEQPGAWIQKKLAMTADGRQVQAWDSGAVCWCASGALMKVLGNAGYQHGEAMDRLRHRVGSVTVWNDTPGRTQAEVLAVLREAGHAS